MVPPAKSIQPDFRHFLCMHVVVYVVPMACELCNELVELIVQASIHKQDFDLAMIGLC